MGQIRLTNAPVNVDVRDVDMSMLVRRQRLLKTGALLARLPRPASQPAGFAQHPVHTRRTDRDHVGVDHHIGQPSIPFRRIELLEIQDRLLFPIL